MTDNCLVHQIIKLELFPWTNTATVIWASSLENLSSKFPSKRVSNRSPQPQRLARKIEILPVARLNMVLSKNQITKALIRLHKCAGWSAPVLFPNPRRPVFSHQGPFYICFHRVTSLAESYINSTEHEISNYHKRQHGEK